MHKSQPRWQKLHSLFPPALRLPPLTHLHHASPHTASGWVRKGCLFWGLGQLHPRKWLRFQLLLPALLFTRVLQHWHCCSFGLCNSLWEQGSCPMYCWMFSSTPGFYPLDTSGTSHKDVSKHCEMPWRGWKYHPWLRATAVKVVLLIGPVSHIFSSGSEMLRPSSLVVHTGPGSMFLPSQPKAYLSEIARWWDSLFWPCPAWRCKKKLFCLRQVGFGLSWVL